MTKSRRRFTALLIAGALLTGACSDGGGEKEAAENPEQAFSDALDALSDYEGITLVMSIQADPDDLTTGDVPADVADKLVSSSITMSAKGETPEDSQGEFLLNVDGNEDAAHVKVLGESLYARVEVRELTEAFGGDPSTIDTAVQQATAAGLDFAQAVADGEWVGAEGLGRLVEQFAGMQPTPDPDQAAALADRLVAILEQNAEVSSEGTDDVGAHLVVRVPLKETARELMDAVQSLSGAPEGAFPTDALDDVPEGDVPVDVWVSDGRLVQVELDFVAIARELGEEAPEGVDEFALRLEIEEFTDEVEAPEEFVEIDLEEIMQGVFGAAGMMPETEAGEAVPPGGDRKVVVPELGLACSDLQMLSPDEIQTFLDASGEPGAFKKVKRACPELF